MKIIPENVPLHLTRVDSALGQWLIAARAFSEAIAQVVKAPMAGLVRPERERH